jgi:hypothetical protein
MKNRMITNQTQRSPGPMILIKCQNLNVIHMNHTIGKVDIDGHTYHVLSDGQIFHLFVCFFCYTFFGVVTNETILKKIIFFILCQQ